MNKNQIALVFSLAIATANVQAACSPTPYSRQLKQANGKITIDLPAQLQGAALGGVEGGGAYRRTMFAALGPSVVQEILNNYTCKVGELLTADKKLSIEERTALLEAWEELTIDLRGSAVDFFAAWSEGVKEGRESSPVKLQQELSADQLKLGAIASKLPFDEFLVSDTFGLYVEAVINGIKAGACGDFTRSALVENAHSTQHLANAVRPAVQKYLASAKSGPRNAKMDLYVEASTIRTLQPSKAGTDAQELCRKSVATVASTAASATKP